MISSLRSLVSPPKKPSAQSARPSSCIAPVSAARREIVRGAESSGGTPSQVRLPKARAASVPRSAPATGSMRTARWNSANEKARSLPPSVEETGSQVQNPMQICRSMRSSEGLRMPLHRLQGEFCRAEAYSRIGRAAHAAARDASLARGSRGRAKSSGRSPANAAALLDRPFTRRGKGASKTRCGGILGALNPLSVFGLARPLALDRLDHLQCGVISAAMKAVHDFALRVAGQALAV